MIDQIRAAIELWRSGSTAEARELFDRLWDDRSLNALSRCFLAHSVADIQNDPREEVRWDVLALNAAAHVTEEEAAERNVPGGRLGLYPSLHLNLTEAYLKLGDDQAARDHYFRGREFLHVLRDDAYGDRLRAAFEKYEGVFTASG